MGMTTLRVVIDDMLDPADRGVARYTEELTRALIETAPRDCEVEGIVSASTEADYNRIDTHLPGLASLHKSALSRRELLRAWQHGFTAAPGRGLIHGTSLLAPLRKHDRLNTTGDQVVVTIHDTIPWTAPETSDGRPASWFRAMTRRALKHADAVVLPTHSLADELAEFADFGDRIRVIPPAAPRSVTMPHDSDARAAALALPEQYLVTLASLNPRKGLDPLLEAIGALDVPLVVVGSPSWGDTVLSERLTALGIPESRLLVVESLDDPDYATVLGRAAAFIDPATVSGSAAPILEAMQLGTPIVTADRPDARELAADAALFVERDSGDAYSQRLGSTIGALLSDDDARERLSVLGKDRSRVFTWAGAAEKVWQLHADL